MATEPATMERLEKILGDFKEAIVICDPQAWILLFNPQAKQLFGNTMALNLRHSLYGLCHQAPFEHAFRRLRGRSAADARFGADALEVKFVCATIRDSMLLNCHLRQVPDEHGRESVFVLFFSVIPPRIDETGWKASFLAGMIEELRRPLANLHAAAENVQANPELPLPERIEFDKVIAMESRDLIQRFEAVVRESRALTYCQWPLVDIYSADLVRCVVRGLNREGTVRVTMTGVPLWLHADSHSLGLVLEALVRAVRESGAGPEIDIEVLPGERTAYCDIVWQGDPAPQGVVASWFRIPLPDTTPGLSVADVLERHNSDMWCLPYHREGYFRLRIPVPDARGNWDEERIPSPPAPPAHPVLPPEEATVGLAELADRPLSSLAYVVYNAVTTGLDPLADHDLLALAGVRIERLRILSDDSFQTLVNPRRPIPSASIARHGITPDMVRGQPPLKVVRAEFSSFADGAVLVVHNGAAGFEAIRGTGGEVGIGFGNCVLDTLLLSLVAGVESEDHTLEGLGQRLGVSWRGGHDAMGDCLLTALVFLRLLELFQEKGVVTLGQLLGAVQK